MIIKVVKKVRVGRCVVSFLTTFIQRPDTAPVKDVGSPKKLQMG